MTIASKVNKRDNKQGISIVAFLISLGFHAILVYCAQLSSEENKI
jgi:hypothetical protein